MVVKQKKLSREERAKQVMATNAEDRTDVDRKFMESYMLEKQNPAEYSRQLTAQQLAESTAQEGLTQEDIDAALRRGIDPMRLKNLRRGTLVGQGREQDIEASRERVLGATTAEDFAPLQQQEVKKGGILNAIGSTLEADRKATAERLGRPYVPQSAMGNVAAPIAAVGAVGGALAGGLGVSLVPTIPSVGAEVTNGVASKNLFSKIAGGIVLGQTTTSLIGSLKGSELDNYVNQLTQSSNKYVDIAKTDPANADQALLGMRQVKSQLLSARNSAKKVASSLLYKDRGLVLQAQIDNALKEYEINRMTILKQIAQGAVNSKPTTLQSVGGFE